MDLIDEIETLRRIRDKQIEPIVAKVRNELRGGTRWADSSRKRNKNAPSTGAQ